MTLLKFIEPSKNDIYSGKIRLIRFYDEGHAWLQVNKQTLEHFGLSENDFSEFSYVDGNFLYLEEDSDAEELLQAIGNKAKLTFKERECNDQFNIRAMQRIRNGYNN